MIILIILGLFFAFWVILNIISLKSSSKSLVNWLDNFHQKNLQQTDLIKWNIFKLNAQLNISCLHICISLVHPEDIGIKSVLREKTGVDFSAIYFAGQFIFLHDTRQLPALGFIERLKENYYLHILANQESISVELSKKMQDDDRIDIFSDYEPMYYVDFPIKQFVENPKLSKKFPLEITQENRLKEFFCYSKHEDEWKYPNCYSFQSKHFYLTIDMEKPKRNLDTTFYSELKKDFYRNILRKDYPNYD